MTHEKWISVHDRLPDRAGLMPDESEYVLVSEQYVSYDGEKLGSYVSICGFTANGWDEWDNFGQVKPERITHWMPLPAPPKGEK